MRSSSASVGALSRDRADHLTFRGNLRASRYGWLRLTPAYSVHLVGELLADCGDGERVFDPFCGTGTTALVCAERGIRAETSDINPFLLWLATAKTRRYGASAIEPFRRWSHELERALADAPSRPGTHWVPALHRIEKWWSAPVLAALAALRAEIDALAVEADAAVVDLAKIAFCRTLIECADVSFGHQSMSFRERERKQSARSERARVIATWRAAAESIAESAVSAIGKMPRARVCDARELSSTFARSAFTRVITSPPYPNRMSYVRELRPYMYWLGYLSDGRAAGELDWSAIGGTWGAATSRVARWEPSEFDRVPVRGFSGLIAAIARHSPVLSRYVHKYFCDMARHTEQIAPLLQRGGSVHYIVGNSKFYDVLVPVERIFAELFAAAGLRGAAVRCIRKRTSKPELFEYVVSATR